MNECEEEKIENVLAKSILDSAIEVHRLLGGPGLLESLYEEALFQELKLRSIAVKTQVHIPVTYKGNILRTPLRLDLLVENRVIIEVKAIEEVLDVHKAQVLTYLRVTKLKLGLLINFGQKYLKSGVERIVNDL